jgi:adenosine deaminase
VALLQDREALTTAAAELVADVAADGTRYAEVRFAPASHTRGGLTLAGVIDAVAAGVRHGPIPVRLIAIAMRTDPPSTSLAVARAAAAARADGVVGFDLAGLEATAPDVTPHADAVRLAREAGLGISVHAGEWGGAAQVRGALVIDPDRIAHGGPAADDPILVAELIDRGVTLDLCPTSNLQAGLVSRIEDHPLRRLYVAGVPITLSTDDRTVSATTLVDEALLAMRALGLARDELVALQRQALRSAFLHDEEALRARLLADLATWLTERKEEDERA